MIRKYYDTKKDALAEKKPNERLYYDAYKKVYYTIKVKKHCFWGKIEFINPDDIFLWCMVIILAWIVLVCIGIIKI